MRSRLQTQPAGSRDSLPCAGRLVPLRTCVACQVRVGPVRVLDPDVGRLRVPLCRVCNDEREALGVDVFEHRHGLDLLQLALWTGDNARIH